MSFGGQGARREAGSDGYAEKYRAVVDEGYLKDEPVGQRWGKVEPALWGLPIPREAARRGTESRATSCRNTGRHHLGMPGRLRRNPAPAVDRLLADPVSFGHRRHWVAIHLAHDRDHLLFRETRFAHCSLRIGSQCLT